MKRVDIIKAGVVFFCCYAIGVLMVAFGTWIGPLWGAFFGGVVALLFVWLGIFLGYGSCLYGSSSRGPELPIVNTVKRTAVRFSTRISLDCGMRIGHRVLREALPVRLQDEFLEAASQRVNKIVQEETVAAHKDVEAALKEFRV